MTVAAEDEAFPEARIDAPALDRADLPVAIASTDADADDEEEENVDSTSQAVFIGGGFFPGWGGAYRVGGFYPGLGLGLGYGWGYPGFGLGFGRAWGFRTGFIW